MIKEEQLLVKSPLTALDLSVIVIYFIFIMITGFYSIWKQKNRGTVDGYFLAGRFMFWLPVGASLFATNIGSEHFIGLAGSGAATGLGVASFELNALLILQITGWIFLPVFIASKVCTLPEYMSKRFGGKRIQVYLALISLFLYIFTKISVNLFSGAIFIQQALGWNLYLSVILLLVLTASSTMTGGLTAVIYTDTVQCFVMLLGASFVAYRAFEEIGGLSNLKSKYFSAIPENFPQNFSECVKPNKNSFRLLRSYDDPDYPWPGFIFGQTASSLWYWCTDQVIVQRLLAAKNLSHAQGGTLFAGYLKILPLFLIILPGMISRILFTNEVACVDPQECYKFCQSEVACFNTAYPLLILRLLPNGVKGLMMAGIMAALMSGLSSIFNSASTMFTIDLWPLIRRKASIKELMIVGRAFVMIMVVISILWIPVIQEFQGGELYIYIQAVTAYLSPPIAAVYCLSALWTRMNECGAFWSLTLGLIVGLIRMVLDMVFTEPKCGQPDLRPSLVRNVHYMYFAIILSWITIITGVVISLITEPDEKYLLIRTTYQTRFDKQDREDELKPSEIKGTEMLKITQEPVSSKAGDKKDATYYLKKFYTWFCGVEVEVSEDADIETTKEIIESKISPTELLKQTETEKLILGIFLAIVVLTALFIFIYFSLPYN